MKILLLGSGGREHALAWKIAQSPKLEKLFIAPGNAGTTQVGENVNISVCDFDAIAIVGAKRGEDITEFCSPCGICRQFMNEFCGEDFAVLLYDGQSVREKTLGSLLPDAFKL